jgi:signal transduction histidine kinase
VVGFVDDPLGQPALVHIFAYTDLIAAILNLVLLAVIVRAVQKYGLWRSGIAIGVTAFFVMRVVSRLNDAPQITWMHGRQINGVLDLLSIAVLTYLLLHARRFGGLMRVALDEARFRAEEYERAKRHYTQVVRHRIFNPLTVIEGSARTLRSGAVISADARDQLCDAIIAMSEEMREVTLEPERRDALERDLDAVPRVSPDDTVATRRPDDR